MDARGMAEAEMIEDAKRSTLAELTDWTTAADKVLVFSGHPAFGGGAGSGAQQRLNLVHRQHFT
jgi:hypothetical protein